MLIGDPLMRGAMLALMTAFSPGENSPFRMRGNSDALKRERQAHRRPSMVRGAVLALPMRSSGERRTYSLEGEEF